ncbi:MAG: UDP-N-acetylmuramoyl-L-alanine--D-glutamate ligase [Oscillospiraceae bacterium]|nr:UDP-N-acetylmuramoyl-L-alanine--D-glutamate ligase [Oscillospiraceae bacterium]
MTVSSLGGKRVAVVGVGVSNRPLVRLLLNAGADVTLYDKKGAPAGFDLPARTGADYLSGLSADVIFRSPGVKPFEPDIIRAVEGGAVLTSEIELFIESCPCGIIGVTGSDGKTTTTTIIGRMLAAAGRTVHVGGNIGTPLLDRLDDISPEDIVVLELSSFQLMTVKKSPDTAVITNISPNHLDWHRSMEEYIEAKSNIFRHGAKRVVLNGDNGICRGLGLENAVYFGRGDGCDVRIGGGAVTYGGEVILETRDILIPGEHNVENYAAAIAACLPSPEDAKSVAESFGGVEHRLELVAEIGGVKYYNDSIASSPTRTAAGLRIFEKKVILIAGGRPKVGFGELAASAKEHIKAALLVGEAAAELGAALREAGVEAVDCGDIPAAVRAARGMAGPGDVVLLSPACTSFDQFENFEERGRVFRDCVAKLEIINKKWCC